jgi:hypothetical protein
LSHGRSVLFVIDPVEIVLESSEDDLHVGWLVNNERSDVAIVRMAYQDNPIRNLDLEQATLHIASALQV